MTEICIMAQERVNAVKWGYFACVGHLCRVVKKVLFLDAKPQEYNFQFRKPLFMKI